MGILTRFRLYEFSSTEFIFSWFNAITIFHFSSTELEVEVDDAGTSEQIISKL